MEQFRRKSICERRNNSYPFLPAINLLPPMHDLAGMTMITMRYKLARLKQQYRLKNEAPVVKFDGDLLKYQNFKWLMLRYLKKRQEYSEEEKCLAIQRQLVGDALERTRHLFAQNESVDALWRRLDSVFDRRRGASMLAIKRLVKPTPSRINEQRSIRGLNEISNRLHRFLRHADMLKLTVNDFAVFFAIEQMNEKSRKRFINGLLRKKMFPTLKVLSEFLRNEKEIVEKKLMENRRK